MNRLDSHAGVLLELCSDAKPRGMVVHDRTRLIDQLRHFYLSEMMFSELDDPISIEFATKTNDAIDLAMRA